MRVDAGTPATGSPRRDDIDDPAAAVKQAAQIGRRAMRQRRPPPAGKDRGHVAPLPGQPWRANRVDALVDPVQPSHGDAIAHRPRTQAQSHELPERHDVALHYRELDDLPVQ